MGIPIGIGLSIITDIPPGDIRKRKYGLPGEIESARDRLLQITALFKRNKRRRPVIVVDDVISTVELFSPRWNP